LIALWYKKTLKKMKSTTITSFVLVILLAIQAYAGIIIPNLINYEESIKNLITQDNVKYVYYVYGI